MNRVSGMLFGLALLADPAGAAAQRGDLCFPVEGWAIIARWHLGSAARSAREGWMRRTYTDRAWSRLAGGKPLPAAPGGTWVRTTFKFKRASWSSARFVATAGGELPAEARVFVNGTAADLAAPGPVFRNGMNTLAIALPPGIPSAPVLELRGTGRESGKEKVIVRLGSWRIRAEEVAPELSAAWIKGTGAGDTPQPVTEMPTARDATLPRAPVGLRATLDVPAYWRHRPLSLYLHGVPGSPAVYLNGERVVDALTPPARVDVGTRFAFDGRDTVALVWSEPPPPFSAAGAPSGHTELANVPVEGWGIAALHWAPGVPPPAVPTGSALAWDPGTGADQPGAGRALAFAAEILAVSATAYTLAWTEHPLGPVEPAGVLVAAWSGTLFRGAELAAVREAAPARIAAARGFGRPVWLLTPPTVGRDRTGGANSRLLEHVRALVPLVTDAGARPVPVFDVFNSALRRQRLWPVKPVFSDGRGALTPVGAYLAALVILDTLALK